MFYKGRQVIGDTVKSGATTRHMWRVVCLLALPLLVVVSLINTQPARALSLPLVDQLVRDLLPLSKPTSPQPNPENSTPTTVQQSTDNPSTNTSAVATDPQSSTNDVQPAVVISSESLPQLDTSAPVEQFVPEIDRLAQTENDVLADRIESAALATQVAKRLPSATCSLFFGACWYESTLVLSVAALFVYALYRVRGRYRLNL